MFKFKKKDKNAVLVIADCLEGDYDLYKKLYSKLAKHFGIPNENVWVITDKTLKQLDISKHGKDLNSSLCGAVGSFIVNQEGKTIYALCNVQRKLAFAKVFSEFEIEKMNVQYFGHYTSVCDIRNHIITELLSKGMVTKDGIICTTNVTPNKDYLKELEYIFGFLKNKDRILTSNKGGK